MSIKHKAGFFPPSLSDGDAAYDRGDFETALKHLRPLAEAGNADAQLAVGRMFFIGQGVIRDYAQAAAWYRRAADRGQPEAP